VVYVKIPQGSFNDDTETGESTQTVGSKSMVIIGQARDGTKVPFPGKIICSLPRMTVLTIKEWAMSQPEEGKR